MSDITNSGKTLSIYLVTPGYTITYNTNGGSSVAQATDKKTIVFPATDPTKSGWAFDGWYTNESCTTKAVAGTSISSNITLYAKWIHTHGSWTYSVGTGDTANVLYATCGSTNGDCPLTNKQVSLTLTATSPSYSGSAVTFSDDGTNANIKLEGKTAWEAAGLTTPTVNYSGAGTTSYNSTTSPTNAGTYEVSITEGGQTATASFSINKADRSATVSVSGYTYGGIVSSPSLSDEQGSPTITYYYNTTNSNTGGTLWSTLTPTSLEPGTYYAYAEYTATDNYNAGTTATASFAINGIDFTGADITAGGYSGAYDGQAHSIEVTIPADATIVYSTDENGTYSAEKPTFTDYTNGAQTVWYKVNKTGYNEKKDSATVTISKKEVTISGIGAQNKTYDGTTNVALTYSNAVVSGVITGEENYVSVSATGTFDSKNAGTDKTVALSNYSLFGTKAGNYEVASTGNQDTATASISQRVVNISWGTTAFDYTGSAQTPSATVGNLASGDNCTITTSAAGGDKTDAGSYTVEATGLAGTDSANYKLPEAKTTSFTINKINQSATVAMTDYQYGTETTVPTPSVSGAAETPDIEYYYNTTNTNVGGTKWENMSGTTLEPGDYYIYAKLDETTNYNAFSTSAVKFTVNGANFATGEVTVTGFTVTYDGLPHQAAVTIPDGASIVFSKEENGTYTATNPSFVSATSGAEKVYYKVTKTGYNPKTGYVEVTVNKKAISATVSAENKVYDGTTTATVSASVLSTDLVNGDVVTISGLTGTFDSANAGDGKTVNVDASAKGISGTGSGNYEITIPATTTADITKAAAILTMAPAINAGVPVAKVGDSTALIIAGTTSCGTIMYKLDNGAWSASVPTAAALTEGTYKVYYKIAGDANHSDAENPAWFVNVEVYSGSVTVNATGATSDNLSTIASANKEENKDVTLTLEVVTKAESSVTHKDEITAKAETVFDGMTVSNKDYLDIRIKKEVSGEADTTISSTPTVIEIAYSYSLNSSSAYSIIRDHEGTITAFRQLSVKPSGNYQDGTFYLDVAGNMIYIYSMYFSDYLIASASGFTVSFDSQGGSAVDAVVVADGGTVASLPTPSRSGYTFGGWYMEAACTNAFSTSTAVTSNITVYAKWTVNSAGTNSNNNNGSSQNSEKTYETVSVTYTVVKGDTMYKIARKYGLTLAKLKALNPQIKNINLIYCGQIINVGSKIREVSKSDETGKNTTTETRKENVYIVVKGDYLRKIARKYNMSLNELVALNPQIKNINKIYPGDKIKIVE